MTWVRLRLAYSFVINAQRATEMEILYLTIRKSGLERRFNSESMASSGFVNVQV